MFESPEKTMTLDEFVAFVERQDDAVTYELHQGEVIEVSPSKAKQTFVAARVARILDAFVDERGLGFVATTDGGFKITPSDFYVPDAAYYSRHRLTQVPDDDFLPVAPDLAVEVVSDCDTYSVHRKALRYIELGVRLVWVIYPKGKSVDVYEPAEGGGAMVRTYRFDQSLSGGDVLPGLSVPVNSLFPT